MEEELKVSREELQFIEYKEADRLKKLEKANAALNRFKEKYKW
jgi:hypothetical protein